MSIHYVSFGIIIDDLITANGDKHLNVLGGGGTQTVWGMAAALGSGEEVGLAARVGQDFDLNLLDPLRNAGVNLEGVKVTEYPTPRAWQNLAEDGTRTQAWQSPPQLLPFQLAKSRDLLPNAYQQAKHFHWGIHPEETNFTLAWELKTAGKFVSLEAFRPPTQSPLPTSQVATIFRACNIFFANRQEVVAIFGFTDDRLLAKTAWDLVVHDGENGATVFSKGKYFHVPAIQTTVVDSIGAGNAFCGAFIAQLETGLENAACHAVTAASYVIEQIGLPENLPDRIDYQRRFDEAKKGILHATENDY